ncbi:DNA fragmentation factor subunit alpha-like [Ruditapes philippinarum]|uniref:DNA fragmentation factor subunit alpha-like n=1 Tax=Ruditapes philippinarum TaxID=129788 RepID=UPI00295BD756|nr:DNA fragmentation factor subunit alpha-like [Ruditapes philippinarum]XP_060583484.1 DNA fragmentation factor subunit alpha-like [Ruditapes philippinarum]XP_060583485.1 DNA fragmentation factor subunit alpha-like [Ruditapes philippinarum]XP_060583487.1 DNA fragmentation factor subunit alpha-like [Ruditapes philippinarum]
MAATSRPYKVWSADRKKKKSVIASSLEELTRKGKEKLDVEGSKKVKIVFEGDGTEVDEEEYFQFLPFNTTLMLLQPGECWKDKCEVEGKDEIDYMMPDGNVVSDRIKQLASGLRREITRLITFSNEDLQEMSNMSTSNLAQLLGETEIYAKSVQEACQRHIDDRQQTSEALDLLKLYHKAREHSPYLEGEDTSKRQKFAHT